MNKALFSLGQIVSTPGELDALSDEKSRTGGADTLVELGTGGIRRHVVRSDESRDPQTSRSNPWRLALSVSPGLRMVRAAKARLNVSRDDSLVQAGRQD